jgi:hypothetical protein
MLDVGQRGRARVAKAWSIQAVAAVEAGHDQAALGRGVVLADDVLIGGDGADLDR